MSPGAPLSRDEPPRERLAGALSGAPPTWHRLGPPRSLTRGPLGPGCPVDFSQLLTGQAPATDWWAQVPHFDQLTEVNADWAGFCHRHVGPHSDN